MPDGPDAYGDARWERTLILATVLVVTALAWAYLIHLDRQMSPGIEYEKRMAAMGMAATASWTATDLLLTFAMWTVMMVGMMTPSAAPVLLLFAGARRGRGEASASLTTTIFALGNIAVWIGFSAAAALAQGILHQKAMLSAAMAAASPQLSAAILIAAGAYQLTPWKSQCLAHCKSPLGFLMTNWREGKFGAFRMGARHGLYCLGCCWALMAVLFVVGVMNLMWVAVLTAFVLIEKVGPAGAMITRAAGAAMVLLGMVVAIR
jgi:predicted metal-binding membrane protein